jgi:hypothetical protein
VVRREAAQRDVARGAVAAELAAQQGGALGERAEVDARDLALVVVRELEAAAQQVTQAPLERGRHAAELRQALAVRDVEGLGQLERGVFEGADEVLDERAGAVLGLVVGRGRGGRRELVEEGEQAQAVGPDAALHGPLRARGRWFAGEGQHGVGEALGEARLAEARRSSARVVGGGAVSSARRAAKRRMWASRIWSASLRMTSARRVAWAQAWAVRAVRSARRGRRCDRRRRRGIAAIAAGSSLARPRRRVASASPMSRSSPMCSGRTTESEGRQARVNAG